jgi:hypothetical protein
MIKMSKFLKINYKDSKKLERLKNAVNKHMGDLRLVSENGSRS